MSVKMPVITLTSLLTQSAPEVLDKALDDLANQSWTLLDHPEIFRISSDLFKMAIESAGKMRPAMISHGREQQNNTLVRSDSIHWQDFKPQSEIWQVLNMLKIRLNQAFYLGLEDWECHFAHYPQGSHYDWHIDQSRSISDRERVISFVLYLNSQWNPDWNGELELEGEAPILPLGGRLVLFNSQKIKHQVRTAHHDRWSLTGWFLRSSLDRR